MKTGDLEALLRAALGARERAYAPYSGFFVGAAVLGDDGRIYAGCNVENAAYGLSCCAERAAVFAAVAGGARRIKAVAVVADAPSPVAPCGACRQVLLEFGPDALVVLQNLAGTRRVETVQALLPLPFGPGAAPLRRGSQ